MQPSSLHKDNGTDAIIEEIYHKCKKQLELADAEVINHVKDLYAPFTDEQISDKIAQIIYTRGDFYQSEIDISVCR